MTVKILRGLPASGKSTYAQELVKQGWLRTNRDSLRTMLSGGVFSPENEKVVRAMRNAAIDAAVAGGHDIVVDDTNLNPNDLIEIKNVVDGRARLAVRVFLVGPSECIRRDACRTGSSQVGSQVIEDLAQRWVWPPPLNLFPPSVEVDGWTETSS